MSTETLLRIENLHSGYGRMEILKDISLEIKKGEIVTLIGANGAGKSTTLNTICGIVRVRQGQIILKGKNISRLPTREIVRRGVVQVPEGRKLFGELTVLENLELGAYLRKDPAGIKKDMDRVYEFFPALKSRQKQKAGSLSGGEQQMLAIGRGLLARPEIILLDEPSLGLAPILCATIFKIIKELNTNGTTIFLVEQNAHAALNLAQRGYVMENGRITITDTAKNLLNDPRVQKAYLGEN